MPQPPKPADPAGSQDLFNRAISDAARHNPAAAFRLATMQASAAKVQPVSLRRSALFGFGFATVAALVWAGIALATGWQLGIVAVGAGIVAGLGARQGGRGRGPQLIGAAAGAFAYYLGNIIIVSAHVAKLPYTPSATMPLTKDGVASSAWLYHHSLVGFVLAMSLGELIATLTTLSFILFAAAVFAGWRLPREA